MRDAKHSTPADNILPLHAIHSTCASRQPDADVDDTLSQRVMELSPDAIVISDTTGRIVHLNRQAETLFGFARDELLGQFIEVLLPTRYRHAHVRHRKTYSGAPHARPMGTPLDLFGRRKDGSEFPVEVSLNPLQIGGDLLIVSTIRDVTAMRQLERQLQTESESRLSLLQMVLENMPCGVTVVYGPDARLLLANDRMTQMWGASWQIGQPMERFLETSGASIANVDNQPLPQDDWVAMLATRQGEVVSQYQELIRHADGTSVPVLVGSALLDPGLLNLGRILSRNGHSGHMAEAPQSELVAVVTYQDISAIKATERLKDEFINLTAHELRTPMTLIQGYAQTLGRLPFPSGDDEEEKAEWLASQTEARDTIVHATGRLAQLTDDLLEVSRVQAGDITLHLEPQDLVALARRIVARLHITPPHQLRIVSKNTYVVGMVDRRRMEQVLTHLLTNAIKFSPEGGKIVIRLRENRASGLAELSVQDHGIGIPADQREQIFGRFVRAKNAQESGISGRGLGLYLCRELIQRHGGHLWFRSEEGQGTTFTLAVPLAGD